MPDPLPSLVDLSPKVRRHRYSAPAWIEPEEPGLFLIGYEECEPDYEVERRNFPFWTLELINAGNGWLECDGSTQPLAPGDLFCHGPGMHYRFGNRQNSPFRKYFLVRGDRTFPEDWKNAGLAPGRVLRLGQWVPLVETFEQLISEAHEGTVGTRRITASLETILTALIERHSGSTETTVSGSRAAHALAMDVLRHEFRTLHSLTDLAQRTGYSPEYLCRVFRKHQGATPYQVLLRRKMNAAWLLLRDHQLLVAEVAKEVGFADPLHFSRCFRRVMGCAPSAVSSR
ncbi:MAG: AraC family transcriptional regulator [Verrucomicrobiales bacterium]|nr:AraC family transcriptional regulator [Verrucomicrobiota bacterium JB025]